MAYFVGNIYSDCLKQDTQLHVIVPQDEREYACQEKPKLLILLHGLSDNAATWVRKTSIERYAQEYNLAVLMPEVYRSWYYDMANGVDAFSYITKELPMIADRLFHVSVKREDMLLAGLSMGGYGALRCVLKAPEVFGYCGAFSGAYDINEIVEISRTADAPFVIRGMEKDLKAVAGLQGEVPEETLIPDLLEKAAAEKKVLPKIYMVCGTEDFLYPQTKKIRALCEKVVKDFCYEECPGTHEWRIWDKAIEKMLAMYLK